MTLVGVDFSHVQYRLKAGRTTEQSSAILEEILAEYGVSIFSFTYYGCHPHAVRPLRYDYSSAELANWHRHFNENQYDRIDNTILTVYQSTVPIYWNLEAQLLAAKTEKERQMRRDGQKLGVIDGLSIPIHGPNDDFANLTIQRHRRQIQSLALRRNQYHFMIIGYLYYERIGRCLLASLSGKPSFSLSKREMQCLQLVAQGLTIAQIAKQLSLAERTVNFHIQNCNKKLGTKNKHASVHKVFG